jgi:hypothetical protein
MDELHESRISETIEPKEGQRELLCSNRDSLRCPFLGPENDNAFSEEEIENIVGLGDVLQGIRKRLISEGYDIKSLRANLK